MINFGILVATAGAAAVAWWQAIAAGHREKAAAESARLAANSHQSASEALTQANEIAERALSAQVLALPPPWSVLTIDGYSAIVRNSSGRNIIVRAALAEGDAPDSAEFPEMPVRVEYGDDFRFTYAPSYDGGASTLVLEWSFEGDNRAQRTERRFS